MSVSRSIRDYVLHQLFILWHFERQVSAHGMYFDRRHFGEVHRSIEQYCLFQYRRLYPQGVSHPRTYPLTVSKSTFHIRFVLCYYAFFLIRGLVVISLKFLTSSHARRVLLGTEMWGYARVYVETNFVLWDIFLVCFVQFSLTTSLLDYKFLSLFRMSSRVSDGLHHVLFGLDSKEYLCFAKYRKFGLWAYYAIICTIPVLSPFVFCVLLARASLFETNPFSSVAWLILYTLWAFHACTTYYSNLVIFLIVAKFIQIKQKSIIHSMQQSLAALQSTRMIYGSVHWMRFNRQNIRYCHLQEEIQDYNRFMSFTLSLIFAIYCSVIAYILHIVLFADTSIYLRLLYGVILYVHVSLIVVIIHYCGSLVHTNRRLSASVHCQVVRFARCRMTLHQSIKIQSCSENLSATRCGFILVNDYLVSYETFQLIFTNIAIYFMLVYNNKI